MFNNNVGPKDRVYRAVAGTILISAYFSAQDWPLKWVALFIGLYLMFTAIMAVCSIYSVTGRNTNMDAATDDQPEEQAQV